MLSSGAFNALLKTLEEPPSYVIFILATTEKHKIPYNVPQLGNIVPVPEYHEYSPHRYWKPHQFLKRQENSGY